MVTVLESIGEQITYRHGTDAVIVDTMVVSQRSRQLEIGVEGTGVTAAPGPAAATTASVSATALRRSLCRGPPARESDANVLHATTNMHPAKREITIPRSPSFLIHHDPRATATGPRSSYELGLSGCCVSVIPSLRGIRGLGHGSFAAAQDDVE